MTLEQELEIEERLNTRKKYRIAEAAYKKSLQAYKAEKENEKVGLFCDMYVMYSAGLEDKISNVQGCLDGDERNYLKTIKEMQDIHTYIIDNPGKNDNEKIYKIMFCVERHVENMGYNFYECMLEKLKEMSSEHYDENTHKFVKAKGYKTDYSKCKKSKQWMK